MLVSTDNFVDLLRSELRWRQHCSCMTPSTSPIAGRQRVLFEIYTPLPNSSGCCHICGENFLRSSGKIRHHGTSTCESVSAFSPGTTCPCAMKTLGMPSCPTHSPCRNETHHRGQETLLDLFLSASRQDKQKRGEYVRHHIPTQRYQQMHRGRICSFERFEVRSTIFLLCIHNSSAA